MNTQNVPPKKGHRRNPNKHTRARLRKRRELLQQEFDREGFNLIATCTDVTKCPSLRTLKLKPLEKPKPRIVSNIVLTEKYQLRDLGDKIQVKPSKIPTEPPLICLRTPPHPGIGQEAASDKTYPIPAVRIVSVDKKNNSPRPVLKCSDCLIKPKREACIHCFKKNYYYTPPPVAYRQRNEIYKKGNNELRERLIDLFGESDISD